jgi:hypothetical protein
MILLSSLLSPRADGAGEATELLTTAFHATVGLTHECPSFPKSNAKLLRSLPVISLPSFPSPRDANRKSFLIIVDGWSTLLIGQTKLHPEVIEKEKNGSGVRVD